MARKRLRIRRGTAAQWTTANTVLKLGELGYETDTVELVNDICYHQFKIGDGVTAWNDLPHSGWGTPVSSGGGGSVAWADITGKPSTFAPSAHTHAIADTTGLQAALDSKAASSHSHAIADVTGLQTELDGKAASSHTHSIANVTGLQTELDGKAATSHSHAVSDVTGLQTALDGKAASSHTHAISDTTGLQTALDGKASTNDALRYINVADSSPVTGTSGITLLRSQLIPAGTFQVGDVIRIRLRNKKSGTNGTFVSGIYINTINSVSGASQLGVYTTTAITHLTLGMKRDFYIKSITNTEGLWSNVPSATDDIFTTQAVSSTNINWAVDQYILFTVNPNSSADSITNSGYIIEKL